MALVADASSSLDLQVTLPAGARKGGVFAVSPTGTALPAGLTLSPAGLLQATAGATPGSVVGVIFTYEEPAA